MFSNKTINLKLNSYKYRVEINLNEQFAIESYADRSILQLLCFKSQSIVQKTEEKRTFEFMIFDSNKYLQLKLAPSIKRISNMYMYSDNVKLSPVGNCQVHIMEFLLFKSKFQENGHFVFDPPMYVSISKKNINTITINISTETCKEVFIQDDVITCRLNFCRRQFLA